MRQQPWYPASVTKLMTVFVALSAVRDHRIALDTPLAVSARAAMMPPSKMGFRPGSLVTLDNALKMLMVKSANDIAVVIAEGVSGSVEAFAEDMNGTARELGLTQSHFVNPNGLPDPEHVSSARDLAILARALYLTFPEQANLFNIGAMRLGGQIIPNHNNLLGRYPGADGMKTGFTCAAGWNLVASASRDGRKLIAVILGAPSLRSRTIMAAALFDRGFAGIDRPSKSLADLAAQTSMNSPAAAPDMHQTTCRKRGKAVAQFNADLDRLMAPLLAAKAKTPAASRAFCSGNNRGPCQALAHGTANCHGAASGVRSRPCLCRCARGLCGSYRASTAGPFAGRHRATAQHRQRLCPRHAGDGARRHAAPPGCRSASDEGRGQASQNRRDARCPPPASPGANRNRRHGPSYCPQDDKKSIT